MQNFNQDNFIDLKTTINLKSMLTFFKNGLDIIISFTETYTSEDEFKIKPPLI